LGVTDGAPDFDPGVDISDLSFDGMRCRLKGLSRKVGFKPVIKGTIKEFGSAATGNQLNLLEPGLYDPNYQIPAPTLTPSTTGGTLAAGTYYYKVSAIGPNGEESFIGLEANCTTTGSTSSVLVAWSAAVGAVSYRVYRGTASGGENLYWAVASGTSWTDTGAAGTAGSPVIFLAVATFVPKPAGSLLVAAEYIQNLRWIFELGTSTGSGPYVDIYFPIALCTKWSMKGQDKKEAQISFEFEAVGDPTVDLGTAPYLIERRSALPTT
jgi:hypothetical protein